ncbi:hypothetical protein [Aquimarina sp. AU119]|uniref:hypothetical protein n=1 Tax=Aquimarina sp. AU119 TaxID=2108528 RepID=UPI000D68BA19|nr:hypothetical protein [Aquimarina sp. AU119]
MNASIQNRNQSYLSIIGKLSEKRKLIFQLIRSNEPCTSVDIRNKHHIPINEITGRVTELKFLCLIEEADIKKNQHSQHNNTAYSTVKSLSRRIDLINQKYAELRDYRDQIINDYNLGLNDATKEILNKELKKTYYKINALTKVLKTIEA